MKKEEPLENCVFSRDLDGTGDRIRTNDTPGMNRIIAIVYCGKNA